MGARPFLLPHQREKVLTSVHLSWKWREGSTRVLTQRRVVSEQRFFCPSSSGISSWGRLAHVGRQTQR